MLAIGRGKRAGSNPAAPKVHRRSIQDHRHKDGAPVSKELVSSIDIAAPAERVWEVLVDFAAFPTWNPFITSAEGRPGTGGRLTLRMQPVGGSAVTLRPSVIEVVEGHRLRWQKRLGVRGLFDADHLFIVEPRGAAGPQLV